jgi:pre-mRNA cleavage complex 2 protein Pcf11
LTTPDVGFPVLKRPQPNIISMMYERLPLKCNQCATRFSDDEVGSKARDDHLDLHFRQNRRASQTVGRGHCRSWFVGTDVSLQPSSPPFSMSFFFIEW